MKRIRWKKLKKLVFDHPYFEYKPHLISEEEADRILSEGYPSVDEFLEIVKRRVELNDYDTEFVLPEPERKARMPRNKLVARLAIGIAAVLLLSAFLAFTEPGIALARAVRNFVVSIFDGSFMVQGHEMPSGLPPINTENMPAEFPSLSDAAKFIGRPVADISDGDSILKSIQAYALGPSAAVVMTEYLWKFDVSYIVTQSFYSDSTIWSGGRNTDNSGVVEYVLANGITLYAGYMEDGSSSVNALGTGVNIIVKSDYISREELLQLAAGMSFVNP